MRKYCLGEGGITDATGTKNEGYEAGELLDLLNQTIENLKTSSYIVVSSSEEREEKREFFESIRDQFLEDFPEEML